MEFARLLRCAMAEPALQHCALTLVRSFARDTQFCYLIVTMTLPAFISYSQQLFVDMAEEQIFVTFIHEREISCCAEDCATIIFWRCVALRLRSASAAQSEDAALAIASRCASYPCFNP